MILNDRKGLYITLVVIIYLATPKVHPGSEENQYQGESTRVTCHTSTSSKENPHKKKSSRRKKFQIRYSN
jgi:hypothetical protein